VGTRDNTTEEGWSSWGLPTYIIGGYPYDYLDLPDPGQQSHAGGTYLDWSWYIQDRTKSGGVLRIQHQRGGLCSLLNNSPVFTYIGGKKYSGNVVFP
jgi:hypothetical protein